MLGLAGCSASAAAGRPKIVQMAVAESATPAIVFENTLIIENT